MQHYLVDIHDENTNEYFWTFRCEADDREHAMEQALDACVRAGDWPEIPVRVYVEVQEEP